MFAQILKHICKVNVNQFQIPEVTNSVNQYKLSCLYGFALWKHNSISIIISLYLI